MDFRAIFGAVLFSATQCGSPVFSQDIIAEQDGLGLGIDEIITDQGKVKVELGASYSAISQDEMEGYFYTIQTGSGEFIDVPIALGRSQREADMMIVRIGGRYGLSETSELYSRASFLHENNRFVDGVTGDISTQTYSDFSSLTLGLNHRFRKDDEHFGIVGFSDVTVIENVGYSKPQLEYGKSATVGLTAYRAFDPVVLSTTLGYRPSFSRLIDGQRIDPGNTVFFTPNIAFAVNNEITLTGGVSVRMAGAENIDGVKHGTRTTRGNLEFGVARTLDRNTTLDFEFTTGIVGDRSLTMGFTFSKALDGFDTSILR